MGDIWCFVMGIRGGQVKTKVYAMLCAVMLLLGGCGEPIDPELKGSVKASIEEKMADAFSARGVTVQGFELSHEQAERYQGLLQVKEQGEMKEYPVEVQFDGTYFLWKIPTWEE